MRVRRRQVELIRNDPFIDVAFLLPLLNEEAWRVIERQSLIFIRTGDIGEETVTFRNYRASVRGFVVSLFKGHYSKIDSYLTEEVVDWKARGAWRALLAWFAFGRMLQLAGSSSEMIPSWRTLNPSLLSSFIENLIREISGNRRAHDVLYTAFQALEEGVRYDLMPFLWLVNQIMENKVFEGVYKYQYLFYSMRNEIESFARNIEGSLAKVEGHEHDLDYMLYEVQKSLLSRSVELRGQYINKLQRAVLFVKLRPRTHPRDFQEWKWFVRDDVMTYAAATYMVALQDFAGRRAISLDLMKLIAPRKGIYAGAASALASLLFLSPILLQYAIEARNTFAVTPADIAVAVSRLIKKHGEGSGFTSNIEEVAKEILEFWDESDILRRIKASIGSVSISTELLYKSSSFTDSLALLIESGVDGIHIATTREPVLRLPPRGIGYDSIFIRPNRFMLIVKNIWE